MGDNNDTFLSRIFGMNSVYNQPSFDESSLIDFDQSDIGNGIELDNVNDGKNDQNLRDAMDDSSGHNSDTNSSSDNKTGQHKTAYNFNASVPKQKSIVESESDYDSDLEENVFNELRNPNVNKQHTLLSSVTGENKSKKQKKGVTELSEINELDDSYEESDFDPESLLLNNHNIFNNNQDQALKKKTDKPQLSQNVDLQELNIQGKVMKKINNIRSGNFVKNRLPFYESSKDDQNRKLNDNQSRKKKASYKKSRLNNRERALWLWANIENLDIFLQDLYNYYLGNGYQIILVSRVIDLLTLVFVIWFSSYLTLCIDYKKLPNSTKLSEVKVQKCFSHASAGKKILFFGILAYLVLRVIQLYYECLKLNEIRNFYNSLLLIEDDELQTISWQLIVGKLINLKQQNALTSSSLSNNPSNMKNLNPKIKLDALNIANRIMRKENYMIALFNKKILDLSLPIPLMGKNTQILTKTLEWNLNLCIVNFVFNEQGQIKSMFLKEQYRNRLSEELRKRFMLAGILNLFLSPFIVIYFLLLYFFRYFNEYKSKPSLISSRQYTPLAEWRLREFNELYHLFQKRLNLSVPAATNYVDQFPNSRKNIILKFISLISGSFAAVLGIYSVVDPENFLNFEITKDRTVLFYISIFGSIWALARNSLPEENLVFDPEASLRYLSQFTHYLPNEWEGRLHSEEVKSEFCEIFSLRILVLFTELASLILAPFILWFKLSESSTKIIDFFREFSIHVDGLGYVCTFAMFNFEKKNKVKFNRIRNDDGLRENYYHDDKMIKSYLYFMESYGQNENQMAVHNPIPQSNINQQQNLQTQLRQRNMVNSIYPENSVLNSKWQPKSSFLDHQNQAPTTSVYMDKPKFPLQVNSPLGESFQVNYKFDETNKEDDNDTGGVLGLLNQFYKHADIGR